MSGEVFDAYAAYYDLLNRDKDYAAEVAYVRGLMLRHAKQAPLTILELGCGTGIHACLLARQGARVVGVDASPAMLASAARRAAEAGLSQERVAFTHGDARSYRNAERFDAVTALFHVMSYQTSAADLRSMVATAGAHLAPGGLFAFDFWYGPAVLWQRPSLRVKRLANERVRVTRIAEPVLRAEANMVEVNYTMFVEDIATSVLSEIRETHRMRYLFMDEIDRLLIDGRFERVGAEQWMTGDRPSVDSWGLCVVARKC